MTYEKTLEHHSVDRYVTDSVHSIGYIIYYSKLFGIDCALVFFDPRRAGGISVLCCDKDADQN